MNGSFVPKFFNASKCRKHYPSERYRADSTRLSSDDRISMKQMDDSWQLSMSDWRSLVTGEVRRISVGL